MKIYQVLTTMAFLLLFYLLTTVFPTGRAEKGVSIQGQRRTITVSQQKDPPIEIISIELGGRILLPNMGFNAPDGWTEDLHIKVKNNSEEPITRIKMILGIFSLTDPDVAALTAHYWFGTLQGTESLQPGDTVELTHVGTKGDNKVPGAARLTIASVIWNGDDSLKWDGGGIRRKEPGRVGEPPVYRPAILPIAKVPLPKGLTSP